MEQLPLELGLSVCKLLEVRDIKQVRLVSKSTCEIATSFLVSEIRLLFLSQSFERLLAISKHPVIRKQIRSVYYEPDMLDAMGREKWEGRLLSDDFMKSIPAWLPHDAAEDEREEFQLRMNEHSRKPRHSYSKDQLNAGWRAYQGFYQDQQNLVRQRWGVKDIEEAFTGLSNLKTFRMSMAHNLEVQSDHLRQAFSAGLKRPFGDDFHGHASGVPQLQSILLGMSHTGIHLRTFECKDVSWKLFRCPKSHLKEFATVLAQVRTFKLLVSTGVHEDGDRIGTELPACRRFLKNGRLRDLIFQMRDVENLEISFDWWEPVFAIELINIVGEHIWPRLKKVFLSRIEATEEHSLRFLDKHAATLRDLHFDTVCLTSGQWPSLLPRIRSSLALKDFLLEGQLLSNAPHRNFDLGMEEWDDYRILDDVPKIEKREAFQKWFKDGGECPFTDEWSWS